MRFKYDKGNLAIYSGYSGPLSNKQFIFIVYENGLKRCKGDLIPHKYYSGKIIRLERNEDGKLNAVSKLTREWGGVPIMNVLEKELSDVNINKINLASLF